MHIIIVVSENSYSFVPGLVTSRITKLVVSLFCNAGNTVVKVTFRIMLDIKL